MERPAVDVIVPFGGDASRLPALLERLGALDVRAGDTVTVVDNRPEGEPETAVNAGEVQPVHDSSPQSSGAVGVLRAPSPQGSGAVRVLRVPSPQSSYVARNRGAAAGRAPWLVFLDADVVPAPGLLDAYFAVPPGERCGVLAGGIRDEPGGDTLVARMATRHVALDQSSTLHRGRWGYAQTANCAVRRAAFDEVGGFAEDARSGGDADLCFRLREAGWELEERAGALGVHHSRATLRGLVGQRVRHGAGGAWLDRRHPGAIPRRASRGHGVWLVRSLAGAARRLLRGEREAAAEVVLEPLLFWAFELGRLLPNHPPARRSWGMFGRWLR